MTTETNATQTSQTIDELRDLLQSNAVALNSLPKRGRGYGAGGTATIGPDAIAAFLDLVAVAQRIVDESA